MATAFKAYVAFAIRSIHEAMMTQLKDIWKHHHTSMWQYNKNKK